MTFSGFKLSDLHLGDQSVQVTNGSASWRMMAKLEYFTNLDFSDFIGNFPFSAQGPVFSVGT